MEWYEHRYDVTTLIISSQRIYWKSREKVRERWMEEREGREVERERSRRERESGREVEGNREGGEIG